MWCPVITLCDFDYSIYFTTLCVCFFVFFSSLLCRVSMYVCVLVDFIFCSYLMGSCQCFVASLSNSLWIATACDCWLLEQNKTKPVLFSGLRRFVYFVQWSAGRWAELIRDWLLQYIGWQWRNFGPYLCQLVFAAILWVKLWEMFDVMINSDVIEIRFVGGLMMMWTFS